MSARNKLRFMYESVYKLKRDYGLPLDIYRITGETTDYETGKKTTIKVKFHIRRGIFLPSRVMRDFAKDVAYQGDMRNAKYQGLFDSSQRQLVIDKTDLNDIFKTLTTADWIVFNHTRWEISEIDEFEEDVAYWLIIKQMKGATKYEVHSLSLKSKLQFTEMSVNE